MRRQLHSVRTQSIPQGRIAARQRIWASSRRMGLSLLFVAALVASCAQPRASTQQTSTQPPGEANALNQATAGSWPMFGENAAASQVNATEHTITQANVSHLRMGWQITLPDLADERPILVPHLAWPDGKARDVLYVTTDNGTLMAIDADSGAQLWSATPKSTNPKYTKASPVADPAHGLIYSYGLDGKVHRFRLTTGQEVQGGGWPVLVTNMPLSEKVSSALSLAGDYLYVTTASFSGDAPPYQGHVVIINTKTGAKRVFNSLCNDHSHILALGECHENGGGIWGRPGVVVDPVTGNVLFTVSDANYNANHGGPDWGDSVVEITPDGTKIVDSYTPENYASEAFQNRDLGSVAPTLLPAIPQSRTPDLAVQAGKEGLLRVINRRNLSGQGGPGHVGGELQTLTVPDDCPVLSQPVAWQDPSAGAVWLFVADGCHMEGYQVKTSAQGVTTLSLAWNAQVVSTSPILADGILFAATSHALVALDPTNGHTLWSSALPAVGGDIAAIHWESPIVVGGRVYCPDENNHLTMYHL